MSGAKRAMRGLWERGFFCIFADMRIIRGKYGRRRFDVPTNITARPTTDFARENIFNVIENLVDIEGSSVVDLFAGTGAVSLEFLSREASTVTAVEKASTQYNFIRKVAEILKDPALHIVRGDALKFVATASRPVDIIFADPPYDLPGFDEIPVKVLSSRLCKPGTLFILEHSKARDYSTLPGFQERRVYGSVNFSIFRVEEPEG